ncbi:DUF6538 domain-containing protein [Beijerinckia sp. L45]|uniref:DUF6538 domain-containing protein n=1 Tax=Beijerinckia sp. L45 TaxID=1641855 RepID=UPI00131ABF67|nr:DUF6538 domain-containing protein [Beijerinckia sp. L45]
MVLPMSRPWKHPKTGVFWLRKRIPDDLQGIVGKREELKSLGTKDPDEAKRRLVAALAELDARWVNLRAGPKELTEREAHRLASRIHDNWLAIHADNPSDQLVWHTEWYDRLWTEVNPLGDGEERPASVGIDSLIISNMRRFALQQADFCIDGLGLNVDDWSRFRLAKAVSAAFQRASLTLQDVASGRINPNVFDRGAKGDQPSLILVDPEGQQNLKERAKGDSVAISSLLERWWREASAAGRKPSTYESYRNTVRMFTLFIGHDDAGSIIAKDVIAFKDHRLQTPSPKTGRLPSAKTVKDSDLSALKTIFGWAVGNQLIPANPAAGITIKLARSAKVRSKGFSDAEAQALLIAALNYQPQNERPETAAAKRWVPWLCAFTGARVGEVAQLRKQDLTRLGEDWVIRITPEAGTVKNNEAREIVLHPQVVDLGFPAFVDGCVDGHLFLRSSERGVLGPLQGLKNRLAEFARTTVVDPRVAPNHGWRHRFKTVGMEAGIAPRILDAIQGQAARSVADTYGDVTIKTVAAAIHKLPKILVGDST